MRGSKSNNGRKIAVFSLMCGISVAARLGSATQALAQEVQAAAGGEQAEHGDGTNDIVVTAQRL